MKNVITTASCKPFLKWAGGKTQLINEIASSLPKEIKRGAPFSFIELFIGSGAILFWIIRSFPNLKKVVINDINSDLTKSYQTIKDNPQQLIKKLKSIEKAYFSFTNEIDRKEFFLKQREKFNTKNHDDIENTALMIFLNRTCFNGLYRVNSKGNFNVPFGKYTNPRICDEQTILADSHALMKVTILNGDFEDTLKHAEPNSIFYFDPPYKPLDKTSSFNSYSKGNFNDNEQIRLKEFCDRLSSLGYSWILSNSDVKGKNHENDFFDSLYSDYNILRVKAKRSINANPEKRGELISYKIAA